MTLSSPRRLVPAALVTLLHVTPVASQEADPPFLELHSTHHSLAWQVTRALAGEEFVDLEFPDLEKGQQLQVVYGADKKVRVRTVPRGEYDLELRIRNQPELLGKIAAEFLGPARRILHMTVFMVLTAKMQMEGRHAAQAIQAAMRFHRQLEDLHLRVKRRKEPGNRFEIDLWVKPRKGTWLHEVVDGIEASTEGAPHLRSPNATLTVTAAAEGKGLVRFLEPFANHLGLLRGNDKEERRQFMQLACGRLRHFDGCFGLMIDGPGRYVRMIGLKQPEDYRKLAAQQRVQAFDCRRPGRTDVVVAADKDMPRALAGSGLQRLLKETDPLAFTEEEAKQGKGRGKAVKLETFAGVVGDFSIKARLPAGGEEMARLVDRVRQEHLRRMPLPTGALVRAQLRLRGMRLGRHPHKEFEEAIKPLQDMLGETLRQIPESLDLSVYRRGDRLQIRVDTR